MRVCVCVCARAHVHECVCVLSGGFDGLIWVRGLGK